jgi:uncharacterized RDD family membrane protein YckC
VSLAARRASWARPAAVPAEPSQTCVGLVTRALAFAIDAALVNVAAVVAGVGVALVLAVVDVSDSVRPALAGIGGGAYVLWSAAYFVAFWSTTGQTPGSRLLRIRVCDRSGATIAPGRALLRFGALLLAALPLFAGFLPILVDDRRRGLHDMLAGTVVVGTDPGQPQRANSGPPGAPEA